MTSPNDPGLSDGTPLCVDFSVAREYEDASRVVAIRDLLTEVDGEAGLISRQWFNDRLNADPLTEREASALFTCLLKNDAASQTGSGERFADYEFEVELEAAQRVLDQQVVVIRGAGSLDRSRSQPGMAHFAATLPAGFSPASDLVRGVPEIERSLRNELFNATSSVRVANPYFDPDIELLEDIASLPQRGVETKVLTRETSTANDDLWEALNTLWDRVPEDRRDLLDIRNLYEFDPQSGAQQYATHAKLAIVDEATCYVGSANLTAHSLSTNFEFGAFIKRSEVATATAVFDEVFEYADEVQPPLR